MNKKKTKTRVKVFISLVASLIVVTYITPRVFIDNTTAWNPGFLAQVKIIPYTAYAYVRYPTNKEARTNLVESAGIQTVTEKDELNYTPIAAGVYAAHDPETGETIVKIDAGTELEVKTIKTDDGRQIKVYVPIR